MVPTLFFYYVSVDGCCSNMPWFQHCSYIMSVWMVVVLTCHGATLFFYYVSVDGCCSNMPWAKLFFYYVSVDGCCSNMPWFQHCSSIMSVWMVVVLTCLRATLFFYYVSVDGCCSNMPWGNIVLLLCQCGWLLF